MQPNEPTVVIPLCRRCKGHGKEAGGKPCIRCTGTGAEPAHYAVVDNRYEPLSHHPDLDTAIAACVTRREIAAAKGYMMDGYTVHNVDGYDLGCHDGLTEAERERVSQALDEAGVV